MKLKNKISGEIKEFFLFDGKELQGGATLKSLAEEWEDVPEEPKEWYWYIEDNGIIQRSCHYEDLHPTLDKARKEIGNYFSSREDAVKAVEKLKAWKRLKDKGFRFEGRDKPNYGENFIIECSLPKETLIIDVAEDLDLLFGGEE